MRDVRRIFAYRTATLLRLFGDTAHTEEEIRAHTIGELQPLAGPIQIDDYDPLWPELFAREAAKVGAALGRTALQVEHVKADRRHARGRRRFSRRRVVRAGARSGRLHAADP